jgi:hypothetical protein
MKSCYSIFVDERMLHMGDIHIWVNEGVVSIASTNVWLLYNTYEKYNMERITWTIKNEISL